MRLDRFLMGNSQTSAWQEARVNKPKLTIGLPIYNGATSLATALNSLLHQSYTDYTLHISDNASTDETALICKEAAARDPRIVYIRQAQHIPAFANFSFLLQNAQTPYFMWAADDDRWHPEFIAKNIATPGGEFPCHWQHLTSCVHSRRGDRPPIFDLPASGNHKGKFSSLLAKTDRFLTIVCCL